MMKKNLSLVFLLAAITTLITGNDVYAQLSGPDMFGFEFRFNNPGARSNAMGGAFISLADDATAAYTNPAGLTVLTKPEFSIEHKTGSYTQKIYDYPNPPGANRTTEYESNSEGISFLSYVVPKGDATFSLYRHQLIDINNEYIWQHGTDPYYITSNIDGVTYGLGMGLKVIDSLSIGISLNMTEFDYKSVSTKHLDPWNPVDGEDEVRIEGDGSAGHYIASLLWNPFSELNIGMVYRKGPEFTANASSYVFNGTSDRYELYRRFDSTFKVPDVWGGGISYKFSSLTISADALVIEYSDILDGYIEIDPTGLEWKMDDETEYHAGLEYVLTVKERPIAIRGGYYYRPYSKMYVPPPYSQPKFDHLFSDKDTNEDIYSIGFGTMITDLVQMDLAASTGDYSDEYTLSFIYRFE
ncbi:MAG: outer membrane protein transport protein [Proteobacteria bacterium]|nr:outer membrane protein transport protein [Pseudomonadota bacterium]MBU1738587.1 outer membrane protein transport protein [Pseudomonadota bacterium]